jgi:hypothetical protein
VKSLKVISPAEGGSARATWGAPGVAERRKQQRRRGIPRRIVPDRRLAGAVKGGLERRTPGYRRDTRGRRRVLERRIGLSPGLDLYLLGI